MSCCPVRPARYLYYSALEHLQAGFNPVSRCYKSIRLTSRSHHQALATIYSSVKPIAPWNLVSTLAQVAVRFTCLRCQCADADFPA